MAAGSSVFDMVGAAMADPGVGGESQPADTGNAGGDTGSTPDTGGESPSTDDSDHPIGEPTTSDTNADATATGTQEEDNYYNQDNTEELPKPQLDAILATPRGKEIYQGYKTLREISKPVSEGGIGHVPSVEEIKAYWGAHQGITLMNHHLNSADPAGVQQFINFAFDPKRGEGPQNLAGKLAEHLASINQDAYVAASVPFMTNYANSLWDRWADEPTGPTKDAMYRAAQLLHKDLTGSWRPLRELGIEDPNAPQGPDPLAEERRALDEQRAEIEAARNQDRQAFQQQWDNGAGRAIANSLVVELDKALAPLKQMHEKSPRAYSALRKDFHDIVVESVKASQGMWNLYQVDLANARRLGTPEAQQQVATKYVKMAMPIIRANLGKFLQESGVVAKGNSDARHTQLRSIDARKDVNGSGGSAPAPNKGGPLVRGPYETPQDFILRQIRS